MSVRHERPRVRPLRRRSRRFGGLVLVLAVLGLASANACGGDAFERGDAPGGQAGEALAGAAAEPDAGAGGQGGDAAGAAGGQPSSGGGEPPGTAGETGAAGNGSGGAPSSGGTDGGAGEPFGGAPSSGGTGGGPVGGADGSGGVPGTAGDAGAAGEPGTCETLTLYYPDGDQDGFGRSSGTVSGCAPPSTGHWATLGGDCNDDAPLVNPGQANYSDEPFTTPTGAPSFDYDCSGQEDGDPTQAGAPGTCGLLSCGAPGYLPNSEVTTPNPICGSKRLQSCVGNVNCTAVVALVNPGKRCR